jgi:hypothetical protein
MIPEGESKHDLVEQKMERDKVLVQEVSPFHRGNLFRINIIPSTDPCADPLALTARAKIG